MRRKDGWKTYAQHECLFLCGPLHAGDYIVAAMNLSHCPKCGEPCGLNQRDAWARVVRRWVPERNWILPWTWRRGHWEYRELGHLDDRGSNYRRSMRNARSDQ